MGKFTDAMKGIERDFDVWVRLNRDLASLLEKIKLVDIEIDDLADQALALANVADAEERIDDISVQIDRLERTRSGYKVSLDKALAQLDATRANLGSRCVEFAKTEIPRKTQKYQIQLKQLNIQIKKIKSAKNDAVHKEVEKIKNISYKNSNDMDEASDVAALAEKYLKASRKMDRPDDPRAKAHLEKLESEVARVENKMKNKMSKYAKLSQIMMQISKATDM